MWIAKPLRSLSPEEQTAWLRVLERMRGQGKEAPLAQSLAWGHAIEAVSGQVHAVFSPEESVGGLVFATPVGAGIQFECINGPLLDWDDETLIKRQLAVFSTAVSRLHPRFSCLVLRPRWLREEAARKLSGLPLEPFRTSFAATLKLPLAADVDPETAFKPRLIRTLRHSDRAGISARSENLSSGSLVEFALAAQAFGRTRKFTVPPIFWFKALIDGADPTLRFRLVTAQAPANEAGCQLLIALHGAEAHYLFGHEWRKPGVRAALSPAAVAHRFAIRQAHQEQMNSYDFNGALERPAPDDPYAGVSDFKAQFGGNLIRYEVPELKIES